MWEGRQYSPLSLESSMTDLALSLWGCPGIQSVFHFSERALVCSWPWRCWMSPPVITWTGGDLRASSPFLLTFKWHGSVCCLCREEVILKCAALNLTLKLVHLNLTPGSRFIRAARVSLKSLSLHWTTLTVRAQQMEWPVSTTEISAAALPISCWSCVMFNTNQTIPGPQ